MPPPEIPVACPGCGYRVQLPTAAIRRNNFYCPQCGKSIPLGNVSTATDDTNATAARAPRKRYSRPFKRR